MIAPLYWSRLSRPHCNCIDIPTVDIRGPSFHNLSFSDMEMHSIDSAESDKSLKHELGLI